MGAVEVAMLVGGILLGNAVLWAVVLVLLKQRTTKSMASLSGELSSSGEPVVRAPESAVYRGASAGRSKVKGNGVAALTATRLLFRPLIGKPIEINRTDIASVREDTWFLRSYASGRPHTILTLNDGSEVGFFFKDPAAWAQALKP